MFIYVITCVVNGKHYVGKSNMPARRWSAHKSIASAGCGRPLYVDIREFGVGSFEFAVVEACESEEASFVAERSWVSKLRSNEDGLGYNRTAGGESSKPCSDGNRANGKKAAVLARAAELHKQGWTLKQIGEDVGRTGARISQILAEAGLYTPGPRGGVQAAERDARIIGLRELGFSMRQIAAQMGISTRLVHKACVAVGKNAPLH